MTDWYLSFIPALLIIVLAFVSRRIFRSWSAPPAFFCLAWSIYVIVPLCLSPDYIVWPWAVWFILGACLTVCAGAWLDSVRSSPLKSTVKAKGLPETGLKEPPARSGISGTRTVIIATFFLGGIATSLLLSSWGHGIAVFSSFDSLSRLGGAIAQSRYANAYDQPLSVRVLTVPVFFGCFVGGAHIAIARSRASRLFGLLPLVPALFLASILTTKATILFSLVSMVSTYVAVRVWITQGKSAILGGRKLVFQAAAVVTLVGLMTLIQGLRYQASFGRFTETWPIVRVCLSGHLSAFSTWLRESNSQPSNPTWGAYTFAGVFDALGVRDRLQGLYDDPVFVSYDPPMSSNIYTLFRGLIKDFTMPGAILLLFIAGYSGQRSFRLSARRRDSLPLLVAFYCFTLWSFVASFAVYNSVLVSLFMFGGFLLLQRRITATSSIKIRPALP